MLPHLQAEVALEDVLAPSQTLESLVTMLASPPLEEPPQHVLARPQTKAPLEDVFSPPQLVESLVTVLASPLRQRSPRSKCFLTFRRGRRWKTCFLLLRW